jgi:hypothetical protein
MRYPSFDDSLFKTPLAATGFGGQWHGPGLISDSQSASLRIIFSPER